MVLLGMGTGGVFIIPIRLMSRCMGVRAYERVCVRSGVHRTHVPACMHGRRLGLDCATTPQRFKGLEGYGTGRSGGPASEDTHGVWVEIWDTGRAERRCLSSTREGCVYVSVCECVCV